MKNVVTSEGVVAYSQCPRKAFLILCEEDGDAPHGYVRIIEKQESVNRAKHLNVLKQETTIVHEILKNYKGVLISDFYGGYDSVQCEQRKCLVHLIFGRRLGPSFLKGFFQLDNLSGYFFQAPYGFFARNHVRRPLLLTA